MVLFGTDPVTEAACQYDKKFISSMVVVPMNLKEVILSTSLKSESLKEPRIPFSRFVSALQVEVNPQFLH